MDLLDEFKYQSYKSRIESLTGTKKPLVDLLKELTTKYATYILGINNGNIRRN